MSDHATSGTGVGDAPARRVPSVPPGPLPAVALRGVSKVYGGGQAAVAAVDHIALDVAPGELVCLVGVSGCGKSTLLNLIAGLDRPTTGRVDVEGRTALMFQDAALFPWLTVASNVDLALKLRKVPKADRRPRVEALLRTVHLEAFADKSIPVASVLREARPSELRQAPPRAVRGHAPTGRARPRVRTGCRRPVDGRAVRGARRHDAGRPSR